MILSDKTIRARLNDGSIGIDPAPEDNCIQPASVDLTLGEYFINPSYSPDRWGDVDQVVLASRTFLLGATAERVRVPADCVGRVEGKSSLARLGLLVHITAGFLDPGFEGNITLEFYNVSEKGIVLRPGMKICQTSFELLDQTCERPYGSFGLNSHYTEEKAEGVIPSWIA